MVYRRQRSVRVLQYLATAGSILATLFGVLETSQSAQAAQTVPYLINFQGRLTNNAGSTVADGSYNIKFTLYDASSGGTNRWQASRVRGASDNRVTVTNGLFNIQFGDATKGDPALSPSLFNTQTYANLYLEVELPTPATATCSTNGCAVFTEGPMTPRQRVASAPYAMQSDTLDGFDSSDFGQLAAANTFTGANLFAPTTSSTVALTVKATTAGSTNSLEIFDSSGVRQGYFNASGGLNLSQAITAPTSTNTINNLVVNNGALSNISGYVQGSGTFSLTSTTATGNVFAVADASLTGNGANLSNFSFTNANTSASATTVNGVRSVPTGTTNANANANTLNAFEAGNATTANNNTINALNIGTGYTNYLTSTNLTINSSGDITTAFTQLDGSTTTNGTGTNSTSMTLTSATNFNIGNYIRVANSAACTTGGPNTCYAKITAIAGNVLTITPALTWATGRAVVEFHIPEIGGLDLTQTLTNRYGRGYFIAGVATGNGTTYYNEDGIDTSASDFSIVPTVTNLTIGNSGTTVAVPGALTVAGQSIVNGSGQINGAQLQTGTVANAALANSSLTVTAGTGLSGGGSVSLGGSSPALNVVYGSTSTSAVRGDTALTCPGGTGQLSGGGTSITLGSGGTCGNISISATPTFTSVTAGTFTGSGAVSVASGGTSALTLDSLSGALVLGSNTTSVQKSGTALSIDLNSASASTLTVTNSGTGVASLSVEGGLTIGSGTAVTVGASAGQSSTVSCGANQAVTAATFTGGVLTTAPSCSAIAGTGATTTLNNVGSTAIGADLLPGTNNTRSIGSASLVWANMYAANLDAGTTTTALTVGTAGTTTAITIGRSGLQVSIPGGVSSSGNITTSGNISTSGTGTITSAGAISAPTATNTINNLVINNGALSNVGNITGAAAVTLASTTSALTLDSGSNVLVVAANDTTLQRTASGSYTVDLVDAGATSLAVTNSNGTGVASLSVEGGLTIGSGTAITVGASAGQSSTVSCGANQAVTAATFTGGVLTTAPSCATINGTGANTTLSNLGTTAITATLQPASGSSNAIDLGTASTNLWRTGYFGTSVQSPSYTGTGAVSVTSGGAAGLTLQSASGTVTLGTSTNLTAAAGLTINPTGANGLNLGTANANAIAIGNTTSNPSISIDSGTSATNIGDTATTKGIDIGGNDNSGTDTIRIATNATAADAVTIGSTNATSLTILQGGTQASGGIQLNSTVVALTGTNPTITNTGTNTLTINTNSTGQLNLGTNASAKTIQIGQTTAAVADTVNIANSAFSGSTATVAIGNLLGASATTIQAGTGNLNLNVGQAASGVIVKPSVDSTIAFSIRNAASSPIFNVDTTDTNPITMSGFEQTVLTNWAALSGGSVARDTTQKYVGYSSGKVTAGTTAGGGISQAITLTVSTQYTLSFYAKLDSASAAFTTLQAGYSSTGAVGGEVDCTLNSSTVITTGWNRYYCTFTTPGTNSGTPYIYIQHNDATSEVFYVDAVQLDTGSVLSPYGSGQISLNANINSPVNFQQSANSTTAFQITNSTGLNILNVDTVNSNINNLIVSPSLETNTTGWAARTGCTFSQDNTAAYNGYSSAKCVNTATANAGVNITNTTGILPALASSTTYTISFYAKASLYMTTFEFGRADNGSTDTACLTAQTLTIGDWKRFSCTFTTGTLSGTPYVYFKQTDAVARTIWIDAVTLETDANASASYRDGRLSLGNATISSPAVFQTNTNSSTAFQIQNASGIQVFNVDTASDANLVDNAGFEVNSTGWSAINGATGLIRDTSKTYVGIASGKVTTAVTANSGMRYTFSSALPAVTGVAYTISAYVQTSAADATFGMGYNNGADTACTVSPAVSATVPSTTGWTRFTCSTPVNTTVNSVYITSGTTAVTLNIDAVRVELGSTATAYGAANISFNGVFTSPVAIRSPNDSTNTFQVQSSANINLLTIDSLNKTISVGSTVTDTNQILLQLDSYAAASQAITDTVTCSSSVNPGSLYYNTNTNAIRSCISGAWEDLVTTAGMGILLFGVVPDSGLAPGDLPALRTSAVTGPCKVSWATTTTVTVQPCVAFSGGRKIIVTGDTTRQTMTTQTVTIPTGTANGYTHICLNAANTSQPSTTTLSATESANLPTFSITSPILCLADVRLTAAGTAIANVFDTRTFTNTTKEYATTAAATSIGVAVVPSTTGVGLPAAANATARGIVVASNGAAAAAGVPNAIIAVAGPVVAKASAGTNAAIVTIAATTGYVSTGGAVTNTYSALGVSRNTYPATACTTTANAVNCNNSLFFNLNLR